MYFGNFRMEKVLIITYYWPPAGGPGVQRWLKWVKYMPEMGITPLVLTVSPEYAEYPISDSSLEKDIDPDLKIRRTRSESLYHWYKSFTGAQKAPYSGFANEGHPDWKQKISRFVRGNFFLPDLRKGWNSHAIRQAISWIQEEHPKYIITTGPPMSTHLIGQKLKTHFPGIQWIADFRDPWTDIYYYEKLYPTWFAKKLDLKMELSVLQDADQIIGVSPFVTKLLQSKVSDNLKNKFHCLTNGFDPDDYPLRESLPPEEFTVCYTGTMADNYPVEGFVSAIEKLQEKYIIRVIMVGKIAPVIRNHIASRIRYTHFIGFVPHRQSVQYLQEASLLLLVLPSDPGARDIIPGKLFEYIGSGTPTLCIGAEQSDAGRILAQCHAGRAIEATDTLAIQSFMEGEILKEKKIRYPGKTDHPYSRRSLLEKLVQEVMLCN